MADILIVDDDPNNCRVLEQHLARCSHSTTSCFNGTDACDLAHEIPFDLIFMDLYMPRMDGFETIKRLRAQGYGGVIIIVTADPSGNNARQGIMAGANGFLAKPIVKVCDVVAQFVG